MEENKAKKKMSVGQYLMLFIFIAIILVILSKGIVINSNGIQTINNTNFEILESSSSRSEDGTYTIHGKVKQKESKNFDGLFIDFVMYDGNNNKVRETTGLIVTNYLGDGIWEFEVYGNDADNIVTSYKLNSIYGY